MASKNEIMNETFPESLETATGKISYNLLNDYMFRIVMQKNTEALKNIIAAVLHISSDEIKSLEVTNTIHPGDSVDDKEFRMDVNVTFNDKSNVDIELQVRDMKDWTFRSLHYLCREYEEGIERGENYNIDHAAYQIGFLDYTLFDDHVKFFSAYEMEDVEDGYKFNSNFALFVIDLSQIDRATEMDRKVGLDKWCRLFKAQTWDELKSIAKEDAVMESIAKDVFTSNSDYAVRKRCKDREEFMRWKNHMETEQKRLTAEIEERDKEISELSKEKSEQARAISELSKEKSEQAKEISRLEEEIERLRSKLEEKNS